MFQRWILIEFVVNRLFITLLGVQNASCCCLDEPRLTQFAFISEFVCLQCLPGSYLLSNGKDKT